MKQLAWHHALILLVAGLVLFTNLGSARLWDRDEPRNAGCAEEMLKRGDLIVPTFNGQLREQKPVLLYWLIMSAYTLFGVNEFGARFWSAALAMGTVLATYQIGRRLFNPQVALWGAIALCSSLMFDVAGRAATPDSVLIFCGTIALMIFVLGAFPRRSETDEPRRYARDWSYFPKRRSVVVLMYAVMGFGILAKGPVGLVIPTAIIGMFLLIMRLPLQPKGPPWEAESRTGGKSRGLAELLAAAAVIGLAILVAVIWDVPGLILFGLAVGATLSATGRHGWLTMLRPFGPLHFLKTCWFMRPLTALTAALVIALPWFVLVGIQTDGEFPRLFFLKEHFGRATSAMEDHSGSPLFYPTTLLVGFFPWSVFTVPMFIDVGFRLRRREPWTVGYLFLLCWLGVYLGVFTLAKTKLPSYVTPCYPALALLAGSFVYHWSRGRSVAASFWPRLGLACLVLVGLTMLVGLPVAARLYLPGDEWLGIVGLVPMVGGLVALTLSYRDRPRWAATTFGLTAVSLATIMFGFVTVQVGRHQQSLTLLDAARAHGADPALASYGCLESTWVFYAKRPIRELNLRPATTASEDVDDGGSEFWHYKPRLDVQRFVEANERPLIITTDRYLSGLRQQLPEDFEVLATTQYFLKKDKLLLVGRPSRLRVAEDANETRR